MSKRPRAIPAPFFRSVPATIRTFGPRVILLASACTLLLIAGGGTYVLSHIHTSSPSSPVTTQPGASTGDLTPASRQATIPVEDPTGTSTPSSGTVQSQTVAQTAPSTVQGSASAAAPKNTAIPGGNENPVLSIQLPVAIGASDSSRTQSSLLVLNPDALTSTLHGLLP